MVPPTYAPPPPPSFPFNLYSPSFSLMSHFEGFHNNNTNNNSHDHHHHHHHHHLFPLQDDSTTTTNQNPSTSEDLTLHDSSTADKGWLRLSIGATTTPDVVHHKKHHHQQPPGFRFGLTELDLLPSNDGGVGSKLNELSSLGVVGDFSPTPALVLPPPPSELNWTFRPISSHNSSSSNCSSSFIPFGPYFSNPFQLHPGLDLVAATAAAGSSSDAVRVIDPPRRPHSGIWFSLQPLELNQGKQPVLPQRSSYLRIKDGKMTVRLLIKYLVKKLRLDNELEIEIRCRGERLEPYLTMQHIRDKIWCSKDSPLTTLLPNSSTIDHIMVLHYAIIPPTPNSPSYPS